MSRLFRIFLLIFLSVQGGWLSAYVPPCPGQWMLEADFLYLFPSVEDTYFVIKSPNMNPVPTGERINNDFDFHPGFRVGGAYAFCQGARSIHGAYTRLCVTEKKTVSGDFLWATLGTADFASKG